MPILRNGLASNDASGTGVDHKVAIDTLTLKQVEIVRGLAVQFHAQNAIGGKFNTMDGRIPSERLTGVQGGIDDDRGADETGRRPRLAQSPSAAFQSRPTESS